MLSRYLKIMYIWRELTKAELKHNKKNPQHAIKPYKAFYICEVTHPEESVIWQAVGYEGLQASARSGELKYKESHGN